MSRLTSFESLATLRDTAITPDARRAAQRLILVSTQPASVARPFLSGRPSRSLPWNVTTTGTGLGKATR